MSRIEAAGRDAFIAGKPITACPYDGGYARGVWRRGWILAERAAAWSVPA